MSGKRIEGKLLRAMLKLVYLLCGLSLLIFWIIGALLPVIPGWPFIIPSVYCFYKFSPELTRRVISTPAVRRLLPKRIREKIERKLRNRE